MPDTVYYNANGEIIPYDSVSPEARKYIEEAREAWTRLLNSRIHKHPTLVILLLLS